MDGTAFSAALRHAISVSGLGLDRIQARLQEHGIAISVTSLSYWQSGKRQPERQSSISAVRVLEEILDIPPGSLLGLLAPPRARGASSRRRADDDTDAHDTDGKDDTDGTADAGKPTDPADSAELVEEFGTGHNAVSTATPEVGAKSALTLVSLHDRCDVGDDGTPATVTATAVFAAVEDGADRWLLACRGAPEVRAVRNCAIGRAHHDEDHGLTLTELVFDHALTTGESQLVEYQLSFTRNTGKFSRPTEYVREFDTPIHHYLLEVRFGGGRTATPRVHRAQVPSVSTTAQTDEDSARAALRVDASGVAHVSTVDFGPGTFGITWSDSV